MCYIVCCQSLTDAFVSEKLASASLNVLANFFCLLTLNVTLKIAFCSFQAAFFFSPWMVTNGKTETWSFQRILDNDKHTYSHSKRLCQSLHRCYSQMCPPEWGELSWWLELQATAETKKKKVLTLDNGWSAQSKTCLNTQRSRKSKSGTLELILLLFSSAGSQGFYLHVLLHSICRKLQ